MKIHREGRESILSALALVIVSWSQVVMHECFSLWGLRMFTVWLVLAVVSTVYTAFLLYFFRVPRRGAATDPDRVFAPADGRVVAVEEVMENEYFKDRRIQVSIFMSVWNVHVNWFPAGGRIDYFRHHNGGFRVAWHPKSSEENERTTVVVDTGREKILFRQIAGIVARRIVSYAAEGGTAAQNTECGIIKFGSRVDIFLPPDSEIKVKLGDRTEGTRTVIARLNRK